MEITGKPALHIYTEAIPVIGATEIISATNFSGKL